MGLPTVPFEPLDRLAAGDPYELLADLRALGPAVRSPSGFVVVVGYEAAEAVLRDPSSRSGPLALRYAASLPPGPARDEMTHRINFLDPPDHPRVRGLVARAFTPRRIAALRPFAERVADDLLDDLAARPAFDLVADYAHQVPSLVISELLGVPPGDRDRLTSWSDAVTPLLGVHVDAGERAAALVAAGEMHAYLGSLLDERRADPGDDLLSALLAAEADGARLSRPELLSLAATLYSAGHRTTRDLTTNGLSVVLASPSLRTSLGRGEVDLGDLVWEFLRFETPTMYVARFPEGPFSGGGLELPPDAIVFVVLGSANRDEAVYADADRFVAARFVATPPPPPPPPLSFAFGAHYCLGASLAKMEAEVMVGRLFARLPDVELAGGPRRWRQRGPFRSLEALPARPR